MTPWCAIHSNFSNHSIVSYITPYFYSVGVVILYSIYFFIKAVVAIEYVSINNLALDYIHPDIYIWYKKSYRIRVWYNHTRTI